MNASKAEILRSLAELTAEDDHELDDRPEVARQVTEGLHHEAAAVRAAALEAAVALVHRGVLAPNRTFFERALTLSSDPDDEVRAESAVLLGVLPPEPSGRRRLEALLEDDAVLVRREAAAALGDWADPSSAGALAARLEDRDFDTRFEAAYALAQLRDGRGLSVLIEALGSERHRITACEGLRKLGSAEAMVPLGRVARGLFVGWPDRLTALAVLYSLGDREAGDRVVERARSRNGQERAYALSLIGEHRIDPGFGLIEAAARDPKDRARSFALKAMGALARSSDSSFFAGLLADRGTELEVRLEALRALALLPGAEADRALEATTKDPERRLAAEARRALGRRRASA